MRDYAKLSPSFWTRGSGKRLRGDADAQVLALYLVTSPAANMIGIYYIPFVAIAHETGLGAERTTAAMSRVEASGFAFYDHDAELAWVPNMASYQIGDSVALKDNRYKGVLAEIHKAGRHRFVDLFLEKYGEAYSLPLRSPPRDPPKPLTSPLEGSGAASRRAGAGAGAGEEQEQEVQEVAPVAGEPAPPPLALLAAEPEKSTKRLKRSRLPQTFMRGDWQPSAEDAADVRAKGLDLDAVVVDFRNHWLAEGKSGADWSARFRQNVNRIMRTEWLLKRFEAPFDLPSSTRKKTVPEEATFPMPDDVRAKLETLLGPKSAGDDPKRKMVDDFFASIPVDDAVGAR